MLYQSIKRLCRIVSYGVVVILLLLVSGCWGNTPTQRPVDRTKTAEDELRDQLIAIHQQVIQEDKDSIEKYIQQQGYHMQNSSTGLFYEIQDGKELLYPKKGDNISLKYSIHLLDGSVLDSVKCNLQLGTDRIEVGLEEGIYTIPYSGSGRLIIPPHLAFGDVGKQGIIPKHAILEYRIKSLEKVENTNK